MSTFRIRQVLYAFCPFAFEMESVEGSKLFFSSFKPFLIFFDDFFFLNEGTQSSLDRFFEQLPNVAGFRCGSMIFKNSHGQTNLVQHILIKQELPTWYLAPRFALFWDGWDHCPTICVWQCSKISPVNLLWIHLAIYPKSPPASGYGLPFADNSLFLTRIFSSVRLQRKSVSSVRQNLFVRRAICLRSL